MNLNKRSLLLYYKVIIIIRTAGKYPKFKSIIKKKGEKLLEVMDTA